MIGTLTEELFLHKSLLVPHIGRFQVVEHSAQLHFAEKLIHPPYTEVVFSPNSTTEDDNNANEAELFGKGLRQALQAAPFYWPGIGTLELQNNRLHLTPEKGQQLLPVAAHKVLRENREHSVLVGDREQISTDQSYNGEVVAAKRAWTWVGWVLLLLALLAIGWHFYTTPSFGSKVKVGTAVVHRPSSHIS